MSTILDVTAADFEEVVLEGSRESYVVVDYWASWCAPCRQLKPLLEKLAVEYGYVLAKVDTEAQPELAAEAGVRGIPDVRIYKDGREVDRFAGALPEAQLKEKFDRYMDSALDRVLAEALRQEDVAEAIDRLNALLESHPKSGKVLLASGQYLIGHGHPKDGSALLAAIPATEPEYVTARAMLEMASFEAACAQKGSEDPREALYGEGACAAIAGEYATALEKFLELVRRDKTWNDEAGRKAMLTIFKALGNQEPLTREYQTKLSRTLY